jgi:hypothetical protein
LRKGPRRVASRRCVVARVVSVCAGRVLRAASSRLVCRASHDCARAAPRVAAHALGGGPSGRAARRPPCVRQRWRSRRRCATCNAQQTTVYATCNAQQTTVYATCNVDIIHAAAIADCKLARAIHFCAGTAPHLHPDCAQAVCRGRCSSRRRSCLCSSDRRSARRPCRCVTCTGHTPPPPPRHITHAHARTHSGAHHARTSSPVQHRRVLLVRVPSLRTATATRTDHLRRSTHARMHAAAAAQWAARGRQLKRPAATRGKPASYGLQGAAWDSRYPRVL